MARKAKVPAVVVPAGGADGEAMSPLDFLLAILRDESAEPAARFDAAKAAAPYVHQRHQSLEHAGKDGAAIELVSDRRLAMAVLQLLGGGVAAEGDGDAPEPRGGAAWSGVADDGQPGGAGG